MKTKIIGLVCLVMAASLTWFFIFYDQDYQPTTDFDETESHLVVWSDQYANIYLNFIKNLAEDEHVTLYIPEISMSKSVHKVLEAFGVRMDNVELQLISDDNIWIRDFGPVFLINESGKSKTLSFKYYGENMFPYEYQALAKERLLASNIISIGGARELNGKGLAIMVEKHEELRNPTVTKDDITKELKKN